MRLSNGASPSKLSRAGLGKVLFGTVIALSGYGCGASADVPQDDGELKTVSSELSCSPGESICSGACVDLHIDKNNCGTCGSACTTTGATCSGGQCACAPGQNTCSGACVDLHVDRSNCGACGKTCTSTTKCSGGQCVAAGDAVLMDPSIGSLGIDFSSLSNPSLTTVPVVFTPVPCGNGMCTTRDAFTKAQPLALPCDVDFLAVGVAFKNVSTHPLYIEWGGELWNMGSEKKPIANAFGQTEIPVADGRLFAPGEVGTGGFIFIAQPPYLDFAASQLPANVPLRMQMTSKGFTSPDIDSARGGYALANAVPEDIIWNNNFRIWVRRTCP